MSTNDRVDFLRQSSWFAQLPDKVMSNLVKLCRLKQLSKGQRLHAKNDPADGFYCLLKGKIRVSNVNSDGKEMVLTWLSEGSWFGEISLFDGLPRTHDAHAEQNCELLMVPIAAFHQLLDEHPEIYPHFMRLLCQRVRTTFSLLDETGGLSLQGQLAKRLLLLAYGLEKNEDKQHSTSINVSQEALAHMINSSRQTVNRLLGELKTEGIIQSEYGQITVLDRDRLEKLCAM